MLRRKARTLKKERSGKETIDKLLTTKRQNHKNPEGTKVRGGTGTPPQNSGREGKGVFSKTKWTTL